MERVCFSFELNPGTEAEYERRHRELWPELAQAFRDAGIERFFLFRNGVCVIGYAECEPDAFARVAGTEISRAWSAWLGELITGKFTHYTEIWQLE